MSEAALNLILNASQSKMILDATQSAMKNRIRHEELERNGRRGGRGLRQDVQPAGRRRVPGAGHGAVNCKEEEGEADLQHAAGEGLRRKNHRI
jgi:hypothetical protein